MFFPFTSAFTAVFRFVHGALLSVASDAVVIVGRICAAPALVPRGCSNQKGKLS